MKQLEVKLTDEESKTFSIACKVMNVEDDVFARMIIQGWLNDMGVMPEADPGDLDCDKRYL